MESSANNVLDTKFIIFLPSGARAYFSHSKVTTVWASAREVGFCAHRVLISHTTRTLWQSVEIKILIYTRTTIKGGAEKWNTHTLADPRTVRKKRCRRVEMRFVPSRRFFQHGIFSALQLNCEHEGTVLWTLPISIVNLSDCRVYTDVLKKVSCITIQ